MTKLCIDVDNMLDDYRITFPTKWIFFIEIKINIKDHVVGIFFLKPNQGWACWGSFWRREKLKQSFFWKKGKIVF